MLDWSNDQETFQLDLHSKGPVYISSTRCKIGSNCPSRTVAFEIYDTVRKARLNLVNWYLKGVDAGELDLTLLLFKRGDWFHVGG